MDTSKQIETKLGKARARLEEAKGAVDAARTSHAAAGKAYAANGTEKNGDTLDAAKKVLDRSRAALVACEREAQALEGELAAAKGAEKRAAYDEALARAADTVWLGAAKVAVPKVAEIENQIAKLTAERDAMISGVARPVLQAIADARRLGAELGVDVEGDLRAGALFFKPIGEHAIHVARRVVDEPAIVAGWIAGRASLLRAGAKMPPDSVPNPYQREVA